MDTKFPQTTEYTTRFGTYPLLISTRDTPFWYDLASRLQATVVHPEALRHLTEAFCDVVSHYEKPSPPQYEMSRAISRTKSIEPLFGFAPFLCIFASLSESNHDVCIDATRMGLWPFKKDVLFLLGSHLQDNGGFHVDLKSYPGTELDYWLPSMLLYRYFDIASITISINQAISVTQGQADSLYETVLTNLMQAVKRVCAYLDRQPDLTPQPLFGPDSVFAHGLLNVNGSGSPFTTIRHDEGRMRGKNGVTPLAPLFDGLFYQTTLGIPAWRSPLAKKEILHALFNQVARDIANGLPLHDALAASLHVFHETWGMPVSQTFTQELTAKLLLHGAKIANKTYTQALARLAVLEEEQSARREDIPPTQTPAPLTDVVLESEGIPVHLAYEPVSEPQATPQELLAPRDNQPQTLEVAPQEVSEAPALVPVGAILGRDTDTNSLISVGAKARLLGIGILGDSGTGKTSLAEQVLLHDAQIGNGFFFLDPSGAGIEQILLHLTPEQMERVIFIEPGNTTIKHAIGLNLITRTPGSIDADAAKLMDVFRRLWGPESGDNQSWGPRMENLLRSTIYVFLSLGLTMGEMPHFLKSGNAEFRKAAFARIPETERNLFLEDFWETDYEPLSKHEKEIWAGPILNKVFALLTAPEVMRIIAQPQTTIDFRSCMDTGKIILVHLNENLVGRDAQRFIGTILIAELIKAVRSRDPGIDNPMFTIAIDEFPKFASSEFVEAVPELRKYGCAFILLGQFFKQLEPDMQGAFKQMATQVTFRVAPDDAASRAWLYFRDPKSITREVEKKLPAKRPIDYLVLAGRPHTNEEVSAFFFELEDFVRMDQRPTNTSPGGVTGFTEYKSYPSRLGPKSYFKFHQTGYNPPQVSPNGRRLEGINAFFYQIMKESNPRLVFPRAEIDLISHLYDLAMQIGWNTPGNNPFAEKAQPDGTPYKRFPLGLLTDELYAALWQVTDEALPAVLKQCWDVVYSDIAENIKARVDSFAHDYLVTFDNNHAMVWSCRISAERRYAYAELPLPNQPLFATATYTYKRDEAGTDIWLDFEKNELTVTSVPDVYQELDQEAMKKIIQTQLSDFFRSVKQARITFLLSDPRFDPHTFTWQPHIEHQAEHYGISRWVFGENEPFSTLFADSIAKKAKEITDSFLSRFTDTVRFARRLCDALVADPILVGTGEMEQIETGKQPVQDAVNEMAGNIIDLPNYTAYVRLGATDTTSKPRMQTIPLPTGVDETILPERKNQAHEQTLALGYATPIKTIEQEIKARRARFGIGAGTKKEPKEKPQQVSPNAGEEHALATAEERKKEPIAKTRPIENVQPKTLGTVVTPAPLRVSRAGTFSSPTLPTTPHLVALPVEKTTSDTYAALLYHFAYASLEELVMLTGKQTSIDYERKKLNKYIVFEDLSPNGGKQPTDKGLVTATPDKSSKSSGKVRLVYSLTTRGYKHLQETNSLPLRKKGNLAADTLAVNDALITLVLAARREQSITLVDLQQEKVFEQASIKLPGGKELSPDGLLSFRVTGGVRTLVVEVDSGSEQKMQIVEKCEKYLKAIQGPYQERTGCDSVTVVFCIPDGTDRDITRLVGILETALKHHKEAAPLFLVGVLPTWDAIPENYLTLPIWSQPFSLDKHALIESGEA